MRNTGDRAGRDVVQLYASPVTPGDSRPRRWLAGFASVTAGPGETVTATITVPERAFQVFDNGWRTVPGEYVIQAARSLADVRQSTTIRIG